MVISIPLSSMLVEYSEWSKRRRLGGHRVEWCSGICQPPLLGDTEGVCAATVAPLTGWGFSGQGALNHCFLGLLPILSCLLCLFRCSVSVCIDDNDGYNGVR